MPELLGTRKLGHRRRVGSEGTPGTVLKGHGQGSRKGCATRQSVVWGPGGGQKPRASIGVTVDGCTVDGRMDGRREEGAGRVDRHRKTHLERKGLHASRLGNPDETDEFPDVQTHQD